MEFKKWIKIHHFHNVKKSIQDIVDYWYDKGETIQYPIITYRAKIKLDGTNACIRIKNDEVKVQSRGKFITPEDDNYGFAQWVYDNMDWVKSINTEHNTDFAVYGEWAGKGIQKRTSVSNVTRSFFPFAVNVNNRIFTNPIDINNFIGQHNNVYTLPFLNDCYSVEYESHESISLFLERINSLCNDVEKCDPFVKETFGIEGIGEGVVMYPEDADYKYYPNFRMSDLIFKVKGEEHETVRQARPAVADPEVVQTARAFAVKFLTPSRLEQGIQEACNGIVDIKLTGEFLKWIGNDVRSESVDELEASGLTWRHVAKIVNSTACDWWKKECKKKI